MVYAVCVCCANDFMECVVNFVNCYDVRISSLYLNSKIIATAVPPLKVLGYQLTRICMECTEREYIDTDEGSCC